MSGPHDGGRVATFGPAPADARLTMILLHGRGAAAEDMVGLARAFEVEDVAFRCPQAGGHTWYPASFMAEGDVNAAGIASAHAMIESLIEGLRSDGVPDERIGLGGFSQGACLATTHAWRYPRRYAAVIGLTGGLIGAPGTTFEPTDDVAGVPVFLASGDPDPHVPWSRVLETAETFRAGGAAVETMHLPGRPHTVTLDEVRAARLLLERPAS